MTDKYVADPPLGDNGNPGTLAEPYDDVDKADSVTSAGETIYLVDGVYTASADSGDVALRDAKTLRGETYRGVTVLPNIAGQVVRVAGGNSGTGKIIGLILDGNGVGANAVKTFSNATVLDRLVLQGLTLKNYTTYGVFDQRREGALEMLDCVFQGDVQLAGVKLTTSTALSAAGSAFIDNILFDDVTSDTSMEALIELQQEATGAEAYNVYVSNVRGKLTSTDTGSYYAISVDGADQAHVSGVDLEMDIENASASSYSVWIRGSQAATLIANASISRCKITCNSPVGYSLALGESGNPSYITNAEMHGNVVKGATYGSATPHGILMGEDLAGDCDGNLVKNKYASILLSKNTGGFCRGNLVLDTEGCAIYMKGTKSGTPIIENNTISQSSKVTQRDLGLLAVREQDGNNAGGTFRNNVVIVQDVSTIRAVASVTTSQVCAFADNLYIFPDTFNPTTDLLWDAGSGLVNFAGWLGNSNADLTVTGDRYETFPQGVIDVMIANNEAAFDAAMNEVSSGSGLIRPVIAG